MKPLRKEVFGLRRANEIFKGGVACFSRRELDPDRPK